MSAPSPAHQDVRPIEPLAESQRIAFPDVARGGAIFGIFLVNMIGFKSPSLVSGMVGERWLPGLLNQTVVVLIDLLATGKFVPIFTFLFGIGVAVQLQRALANGRPFRGLHSRRMAVLALLGLAHGLLLWMGDILLLYALFGFVALLFLKLRPRTLVIWGAGLWLLALAGEVFLASIYYVLRMEDSYDVHEWRRYGTWLAAAYAGGTAGEVLQARFSEWWFLWSITIWTDCPKLFGIFLLGLAAGKTGPWENLPLWRPRALRSLRTIFPVGLSLSLFGTLGLHAGGAENALLLALAWPLFSVGALLLSFSYLMFLDLLACKERWSRTADALACVGRMSLSNYLLQSLVANLIFTSVGLGLYGQVAAHEGVVLVVGVFVGQVYLSRWWLRHHPHGPCEWLWRTLCHGRTIPWRRV